MAGIGFELRRLAAQDNLMGIFRAYTHAAVASVGPWLFTILAVGGLGPIFSHYDTTGQLVNFRIIVIYNFGFSLILSAPIYMVVTRYLADGIYRKDVTHTPTVLLTSVAMIYALALPVAIFYYGYCVQMSLGLRLNAMVNMLLLSLIWALGVYITALKDYKAITRAFAVGMLVGAISMQSLDKTFGDATTLTGFNFGLVVVAFSLIGKILAEYPYKLVRHTEIMTYFRRYWELAVGGMLYNAALWIDKLIMWKFAPEAVALSNGMTYYPNYDGGTCLAYLTIVPSMAIFVFSIETNFFVHFHRFYYDINDHRPLSVIRANHQSVIDCLVNSARNLFIIQGTITAVAILLAAKIFGLMHVNYLEIGIFRISALGALFQVLALFEMVILSYFDCRKITMFTQGIFLAGNAIFTLISIDMGFSYYGYGYFLASLLTFVVASLALFNHIVKLPYHAFITNNDAIKKSSAEAV